jgi:hypothetical protein
MESLDARRALKTLEMVTSQKVFLAEMMVVIDEQCLHKFKFIPDLSDITCTTAAPVVVTILQLQVDVFSYLYPTLYMVNDDLFD